MRSRRTRRAGVLLALAGSLAAATLVWTAPAGADSAPAPSPVTLVVVCYEEQPGATLAQTSWTVYFGYSSTEAVTAGQVDQSHVNGPDWNVDPPGAPHAFNFPDGFPNTNGQTQDAFTATNDPDHGDETVSWHVGYEQSYHHQDPADATFDPQSTGNHRQCGAGGGGGNGKDVDVRDRFDGHHVQIVYFVPQPAREAYCAGANNTVDGQPVHQGAFLDLLAGQADYDPNFRGAVPAIYVQGQGLTCDPPPAGYAASETFVNGEGQDLGPTDTGRFYPYYSAPSS